MSEHKPPTGDDPWVQDQEDSFQRAREAKTRERRSYLIFVSALLILAGVVPALFGFGAFGLKSCGDERVQVWFYNPTDESVSVRLAIPAPLGVEALETIPPDGIRQLYFRTGERTLDVHTPDGAKERHNISLQRKTVVTFGDKTCYALFDMTAFYKDQSVEATDLTLLERIPAGTLIYTTEADTFVVPRQSMPRRGVGTVHWMEDFDCGLLEPDLEDELLMLARVRMEEREGAVQQAIQSR